MAEAAVDPGPRARTYVLGATILASSLAFIDGTVVNVALPTIQEALGADFRAIQWVLNGYMLMLGALILVAGGLGDSYGRRRVFLIGIALFMLASIACAIAPNVGLLIAARAVQGVGAALLVPQSLAIITATFPRHGRGRAIGTWAAASAATTALGPPLGGFLVDWLSWRAVFWINVPMAILAILLTLRAVPESRDPEARGRQDWIGSALAVLGFGALTYGLTGFSEGAEQVGAQSYAAIAAGLAAILLFALVETRVANPVVPPVLFRSRVFTGANIVTVFLYGALSALVFLLPFELIARRGLTAAEAGFTLMPVGIIIAVASRLTGALSDRVGPRRFLVVGSAIVTLSCVGFALGLDNFWIGIVLPVVLLASGMAVVVSPLTTAVMNAAPEGRSGAASGVNNAASRVAGLLAVAIFGAVASLVYLSRAGAVADRFGVLPEIGDPVRPMLEDAFDAAYSGAMWLVALWSGLAVLSVVLFVHDEPVHKPAA